MLIYKITKKDLFVLLYGLNPFVLFEALVNVHNDIAINLYEKYNFKEVGKRTKYYNGIDDALIMTKKL